MKQELRLMRKKEILVDIKLADAGLSREEINDRLANFSDSDQNFEFDSVFKVHIDRFEN